HDLALNVGGIAALQGLSEVSFAVYELLERARGHDGQAAAAAAEQGRAAREEPANYRASLDEKLKGSALAIEKMMAQGQAIVDWQHKEDVQRVMRRDIKRELRNLGGLTEEELT